jgi:RNA polymerase sigma-70 factor (ECF subfamily)
MDRAFLHLLRAQDASHPATARREAFGYVVADHQDAAYAVAYAILNDSQAAQDAALEAFILAWRNLESLREPEAFAVWLRSLVRSQALRHVPRKGFDALSLDPPAHQHRENEQQIVLREALSRLPEIERETVVLFYVAGLTREETASFMGKSLVSTKKRLARALARLRKEMIEMPNDDLRNDLPSQDDQFRRQTMLLSGRFAEMLNSGRPILQALDDCIAEAGDGVIAKAFRDMRKQVTNGKPIADAMLRYPSLFDSSDAAAVLAGEETGCLDDVFRRLASGEKFQSPDGIREELVASGRGMRPRIS